MSVPRQTPGSRHLAAAAWTLMALLALAACSPSASASAPAESAAELPTGSVAASPSQAATVGGDTVVTITGRSFGADITISAGSSVTFINECECGHTVTNGVAGVAAADALFDVSLPPGATSDPIVLDNPGVYDVTCKIHTTMQMTITVV